jgi:apolipoprotein N-acyltransferase
LEILQLASILTNVTLPAFYGLLTVLAFIFYFKARKRGFAVLRVGFLIEFLNILLNTVGIPYRLLDTSSLATISLLAFYGIGIFVVCSVLTAVGLFLLYTEIKQNVTVPSV